MERPYGKRDDLIVYEEEPYNAESSRLALTEAPITATDAFYVRGHGAVPDLDPDSFELSVEGLVERPLSLSMADLRSGLLESHEVVATLQCAGNRREGLVAHREIAGEAPWGPGATGTATWRGVRLSDVLAIARPLPAADHVGMEGADLCPGTKPSPQLFGGSIPLDKALRPEVLLAYEMNGEPLTPIHGAPLRSVVPGYIGARSVKWLDRIVVTEDPWEGYYQACVYRMLPPDGEVGYGNGFPLGIVALNSDILAPAQGSAVAAGEVEVRGYAFAGGERHVVRVDLSLDGSRTWQQVELLADQGRWAWRQWRATVTLAPGEHELTVRAWDSSAATQPEDAASLWNPKGYCNNSQARITVTAR